jgi:homocysteine S-methyltransferase
MYQGKDRDEGEALAVTISAQVAREITPYTDGLYLITPFRRVELMGRILKEIEGK